MLAVTAKTADLIEAELIERHSLAPSSARKVRAHLVQLRGCVARELGVVVPPIEPPAAPPDTWTPRLDWSGYGAAREWLASGDRVACDLVAACHLRPSTVLRLRVRDVGDGGRTVRVRGRRVWHVLPVPVFLRAGLVELARDAEPVGQLFPGRNRSNGLSVVTLRRRFKAAVREALDVELDLRDLSDLAAATLGAGSANPSGRRVALERIAGRWVAMEEPPRAEDAQPVVVPRDRELRGRVERTEERINGVEANATRTARRLRSSTEVMHRSVRDLKARSDAQDRSFQELRWDLRAAVAGLSERLARVERGGGAGPKAARRQAAAVAELRAEVALLQEQGAKRDAGLKRMKKAVSTNSALIAALVMDRVVANQPGPSPGSSYVVAAGRESSGVGSADAMLRQLSEFFTDSIE